LNAYKPNPKEVSVESTTPIPPVKEDLKAVIACNLSELRRHAGMTQQDLAAELNYTDKAISKWERGESVPDILILKQIADLFGVTVDYLLCSEHEEPAPPPCEEEIRPDTDSVSRQSVRTRGFVTGMSILLVWLAALILFLVFDTAEVDVRSHWIVFACAVPASLVLWLVMNSIWFNRRRNYLIISLLMWSVLILAFVTVWIFAQRALWLISLPGIPGQAIIVMWSRLKQSEDALKS
jgi:transcriptional regulator with XRE-family HTH domain